MKILFRLYPYRFRENGRPIPLHRVQCNCGRIYVVCAWPSTFLKQKHCKACMRPVGNRRASVRP